jgi:metallo-beta-lactamase class B
MMRSCVRTARAWPQLALVAVLAVKPLSAQSADPARATRPQPACPSCAEWNAPHNPLRLYGNTYYVGTNGLSAILITSPEGHVLIDGGLVESAAPILEHIRTLGFRVEDVKLILNSHAHYDHAGGIAAIQRASGATVAASAWSAAAIERGTSGTDDPQYGILIDYPPASRVRAIRDGEVLRLGPLALTAHFTPGHTPGGTTWSWQSCEQDRCLELVYADSQTPVSADGFLFTKSATYPTAIADFERGFAALDRMRCDILITPHPSASRLWERVAARDAGDASALVDADACRRYAGVARAALAKRIATESATVAR